MKILIYNWTQFDNTVGRGGGVSVYLRNIVPEFLKRDGVDVDFISSGEHYDLLRKRPYVSETKNAFSSQGMRSFRLINSPIKAPAHDAFYAIDSWKENADLIELFKAFIEDHGPYDVFHLHSLEGISANVLTLKSAFPEMKIFYTLHNYMPYCPQIELLYQSKTVCSDYLNGTKCVGCLAQKHDMKAAIRRHRLGSSLMRRGLSGHQIGNFIFGTAVGLGQVARSFVGMANDTRAGLAKKLSRRGTRPERTDRLAPIDPDYSGTTPKMHDLHEHDLLATQFREWREYNSNVLTNEVDQVFSVSGLVREAIANTGEPVANIVPLHVGIDLERTPEEMMAAFDSKPKRNDVTISFIGYAIPSKGLPFLMNAFDHIDQEYLKQHVRILIICRTHTHLRRQIYFLSKRFKEVKVIDGYERGQLPAIAREIDLNIVPSIWPETFNQVTRELMSLGTPSLTSNLVGASELFSERETFTFRAGDINDFEEKLLRLVRDANLRRTFFETLGNLPTVEGHVNHLMSAYSTVKATSS